MTEYSKEVNTPSQKELELKVASGEELSPDMVTKVQFQTGPLVWGELGAGPPCACCHAHYGHIRPGVNFRTFFHHQSHGKLSSRSLTKQFSTNQSLVVGQGIPDDNLQTCFRLAQDRRPQFDSLLPC